MNEVLGRAASQGLQCLASGASLDALVASVHLGPSLLQDKDPDFWMGPTTTECPILLVSIVGESVVHNNSLLFATDIKRDGVAASGVNGVLQENSLNSGRVFSQ